MLHFFTKTIPFSVIRHNDLACYVQEGFGGKSIEYWPPCTFFKEYHSGDSAKATQDYVDWYFDQLTKYSSVPKKEGGMFNGSLYSFVEKESGKTFENIDKADLRIIIEKRVQQRFALLESIKTNGYDPSIETVRAVKRGGYVYLLGGHHRAAALSALGYKEMPGIFVFPNQFLYNCVKILKSIKSYVRI